MLSQMKWGAKDRGVEDADWATSDKVVLLSSDRCVRVYDINLKHCQYSVDTTELAGVCGCGCRRVCGCVCMLVRRM